MKYTVHPPVPYKKGTGRVKTVNVKTHECGTLDDAMTRAYTYLPLETPGHYHPNGKYVIVQEWDDGAEPLRQWIVSGRMK